MADPFTMAAVSIGGTALGGITSAMGASQSSSANAQAFSYKAGIATLNSQIAKQNAAYATNAGNIRAANYGLKAGQEIANTKVTQAASGLDVNSGSASAVRSSQTDVARYDQSTIRAEAAHQAYGYEVESAKDTAEASLDKSSAENARQAGRLGILSSIIGTAGSVAAKWSQASTIGIGSGSNSNDNPAWGF